MASPNPKAGAGNIKPIYATNLGPPATNNTILYGPYYETNEVLKKVIAAMQQIKDYSGKIKSSLSQVETAINTVKKLVDDLLKTFSDLDTSIITPFAGIATDQLGPIGSLVVNVLFAVLAGLGVLVIVFMIFYACCCETKCQCTRYILHLSWCIQALLMIILFLVGKILFFLH